MAWGKRLLRGETSRRLICWLLHLYIRVVFWSNRWTVEGAEAAFRLIDERRPFVLAFWHGRLLMLPVAEQALSRLRGQNLARARGQSLIRIHMLISGHRDGRSIAEVMHYFHVPIIAGSSNQGGTGALRAMVRLLREGDCIGITPDGPNGPAMRASNGLVNAARLARAPILPITYATSRRRILDSWDRFHLPYPGGRGVFVIGEAIDVPDDIDEAGIEHWRRLIEERMNAITVEADRRVGHVAPAPGTLGRDALRALRRAAKRGQE